MYDANYFNGKKQELQQENLKNVLEAYDDIVRVLTKSTQKTQEFNAKFQKVVAEEKASQEATKKPLKEEKDGQTAEPAETGK